MRSFVWIAKDSYQGCLCPLNEPPRLPHVPLMHARRTRWTKAPLPPEQAAGQVLGQKLRQRLPLTRRTHLAYLTGWRLLGSWIVWPPTTSCFQALWTATSTRRSGRSWVAE